MGKNDEYRANAAECERMAKVARSETDKQSWLGMARHWLAMIKDTAGWAPGQRMSSSGRFC
jgi:hypothetical protein